MFYSISGKIITQEGNLIALETVSGMTYGISVPHICGIIGSSITLYTHLHWNQETGPQLFGFLEKIDREVFLMLISCTGIGPKLAISLLEQKRSNEILQMITTADIHSISALKGIGEKKGALLIGHLQTKTKKIIEQYINDNQEKNGTYEITAIKNISELTQVLTSLKYSPQEIQTALQFIKKESLTSIHFDELLRTVLTFFAQHKKS